jgi:DNA-damage-inducible protein J
LYPKWYAIINPLIKGGFMSAKIQTSLRIDAEKFIEAKQILAHLGMNFSEAVNIFTSQVVAQRGLPFQVVLPNEETQDAMRDVRAGKHLENTTLDQLKQDMLFE